MTVDQLIERAPPALGLRRVAGPGDRLVRGARGLLLLPTSRRPSAAALAACDAVVVCGGNPPDEALMRACREAGVALLTSRAGDAEVARLLLPELERPQAPALGTAVVVAGTGVLLQGPAGAGKSETALALLDRGHALVADDAPLWQLRDGLPEARCPEGFEGRLALRGIGIIDVRDHFGAGAWRPAHPVELVVALGADSSGEALPEARRAAVHGVELPLIELAPAAGRPLPLLVEVAVRRIGRAGLAG